MRPPTTARYPLIAAVILASSVRTLIAFTSNCNFHLSVVTSHLYCTISIFQRSILANIALVTVTWSVRQCDQLVIVILSLKKMISTVIRPSVVYSRRYLPVTPSWLLKIDQQRIVYSSVISITCSSNFKILDKAGVLGFNSHVLHLAENFCFISTTVAVAVNPIIYHAIIDLLIVKCCWDIFIDYRSIILKSELRKKS